jgi:hypothetical protein
MLGVAASGTADPFLYLRKQQDGVQNTNLFEEIAVVYPNWKK